MLDLLVVGAGLSGLCAALTAAQAGLRVRVIARGLGSLHWQGGALDVLGYLPGSQDAVTHPFAAMDALPATHPYRRMGADAVYAALHATVAALHAAEVAFQGGGVREADVTQNELKNDLTRAQTNLRLPSGVGAARPTWRAPAAQASGDLTQTQPMLLVGFRGLRDFYPALMADHLQQQGIDARAAWLPLSVLTHQRDRNTVHLAQTLDDPEPVAALAAAVKPLLRDGERIGFPAILGLARHAETLAQLQNSLDAPVFEIPTLPPSVPGIRIHRALVALLAEKGVRVEAGMEAIHAEVDTDAHGRAVCWVETATASRPLRHRAAAFLLATGGILGGGFRSDDAGRIWEPIFGVPLAMPGTRQAWFRPEFLDPQGHPVFSGGVAVNDAFQPIAPDTGDPCFRNLWAAGNCLAHADAIRERSMEGVAIATGVAAAQGIVS